MLDIFLINIDILQEIDKTEINNDNLLFLINENAVFGIFDKYAGVLKNVSS